MKAHQEIVLATLPGSSETSRLLVVLLQSPADGSRMELRQQSWGEGVGWYTQTSVPLEPHQVAELRGVLGSGPVQGAPPQSSRPALPRAFSRRGPERFLRVVKADSA